MRRGDGSSGEVRRRGLRGRLIRVALGVAGAGILALALAQAFLPKIAASRISSRLGKYGDLESVHVSAWPAIELLWGDADAVTVRAHTLSVSTGQTGKLLWEARGVDKLDLSAASTREGPLPLQHVSVRKRGSKLHAQAFASEADVKAALPAGFDVQLLGSVSGQVQVRASGGLFGVGASVDAVAQAIGGELVVRPRGLLLENLKLTLFADPHVYVEGVAASRSGSGYALSIDASLR